MFWKTDKIPLITQEELERESIIGRSPHLVDVRSATDFEFSRIGTAINIPLEKFEERISELEQDEHIVFY